MCPTRCCICPWVPKSEHKKARDIPLVSFIDLKSTSHMQLAEMKTAFSFTLYVKYEYYLMGNPKDMYPSLKAFS